MVKTVVEKFNLVVLLLDVVGLYAHQMHVATIDKAGLEHLVALVGKSVEDAGCSVDGLVASSLIEEGGFERAVFHTSDAKGVIEQSIHTDEEGHARQTQFTSLLCFLEGLTCPDGHAVVVGKDDVNGLVGYAGANAVHHIKSSLSLPVGHNISYDADIGEGIENLMQSLFAFLR